MHAYAIWVNLQRVLDCVWQPHYDQRLMRSLSAGALVFRPRLIPDLSAPKANGISLP